MDRNSKIFVAGHRGMVGSAIVRKLREEGFTNLVSRTRDELDLRAQTDVADFFATERPDYVFLAAAKVGGIKANMTRKAEFLFENTLIQNNVIWSAREAGVKKLCFLGSSCVYPRNCPQPMKEEYLLTGPLEPTNEGYALAKIAGHKLCRYLTEQSGFATVSLMPCNLYGTNDNYDLETCHALPALIRRFVEAAAEKRETVRLWGTGSAKREFLHVDDLATAAVYFTRTWNDPDFINIGYGEEITIRELANRVAAATGFTGKIEWDASEPDGMPRKLLDCAKARNAGWKPTIDFDKGLRRSVVEFIERKHRGEFI